MRFYGYTVIWLYGYTVMRKYVYAICIFRITVQPYHLITVQT